MLTSPVNKLFWKCFARVVSLSPIANYLIGKAQSTPYAHLDGYMDRFWLFNRYSEIGKHDVIPVKYSWLPSVRIHHILREDYARDMHDHPWDARTIILKGDYDEDRMISYERMGDLEWTQIKEYHRRKGDTATLNFGEYHNITRVSKGGVWTMFITYGYRGTWGFWVNGKKIPHGEYVEKAQVKVA